MPSFTRSFFLAVHVAILSSLIGSPLAAVTTALASPSPAPMPLPFIRSPDYAGFSPASQELKREPKKAMRIKHKTSHAHTEVDSSTRMVHRAAPVAVHSPMARHSGDGDLLSDIEVGNNYFGRRGAMRRGNDGDIASDIEVLNNYFDRHARRAGVRRDDDILSKIAILNNYYNGANTHATKLKSLAAQSSSKDNDDSDFQQQCATEMTGFQTNFLGFQKSFSELGGDKGLANYDKSNQLETLLKDVVNANKNALSATTVLVYNIPGLGPILGPIVYEIKCIIDALLDLTENLSDATLNALGVSLLKPLDNQAVSATCASGIQIANLCL